MTDQDLTFIYEVLKKIQADQADFRRDLNGRLGNIELRLTAIEHHLAGLIVGLPAYTDRMDGFERRLARVERRLELSDENP